MKFIECGIGNRWLIRTETESEDGTEHEVKGIVLPIQFQSMYVRVGVGKTVWILDSREGIKRSRKERTGFKLVVGIVSL